MADLLDTVRANARTVVALNNNKDPKSISAHSFGFLLATNLVLSGVLKKMKYLLESQ